MEQTTPVTQLSVAPELAGHAAGHIERATRQGVRLPALHVVRQVRQVRAVKALNLRAMLPLIGHGSMTQGATP